jgi:NAD+ dependent glucose-6-phosphate dehydrogenase
MAMGGEMVGMTPAKLVLNPGAPDGGYSSGGRAWLRQMWLSNRDCCQLLERCIAADPAIGFAVVNGMSANAGMRWDIEYTRRLLGYEPQD